MLVHFAGEPSEPKSDAQHTFTVIAIVEILVRW